MLSVYQNSNVDYNSTADYERITKGFIVRRAEYETIISSLKNRKSGDSIQHELILGRRGSGKSTLLKRIEVEISENEKLNAKYIPVNPAEEQAGIYRLMDLWEQVLQELYCRSEEKQETKNFHEFDDEQAYTRYLYGEIHHFCEHKKKKAVLLLDNFDRIAGNLDDDGNLLRETLINYHDLVFIVASARMDEHFWQYDQPFYEFFRRHRLETLSSEETFKLLKYWSDSPDFDDAERKTINDFLQKFPGKVETIRLLTDGLPRTMLFFLKIVMQNEKSAETTFLRKVMDEVTPLYQERLFNQQPPMRKILLEMAFMWEAAATKEIAERCRMESKLVAAHLKTLTDRGIVETIATDKRNNLYRIAERFFNMWLIVTQGNPDQKRKARWMSEFLEVWYDRQDLQDMARQHIDKLREHKITGNAALMLTKALCQSKYISISDRDEMIKLTRAELKNTANNSLTPLPDTMEEIAEEIDNCINKKDFTKAHKLVNSIENEADGWKEAIHGAICYDEKQYDDAEQYYLQAIEKGHVDTMSNLGVLYANQEKFDLAEQYYLQAVEKGHVKAMYNLALLYANQEKYDLAEKYWLQAIENGDVGAMYNLGLLYANQEKYDLAEQYYLQAIEKGDVKAMFNLGLLYNNQEKFDLTEKYYLQAIENGNVGAMYNLALMYYFQNKNKEQVKQYIGKYEGLEIGKILIEIWAGVFNDIENRAIIVCRENKENAFFIERLLVHYQKSLVDKLFHHEEFGRRLQEQYTVLYYASQILNGKETENNLQLRIPPELQSTVDEVLEKIEEEQKRYAQ